MLEVAGCICDVPHCQRLGARQILPWLGRVDMCAAVRQWGGTGRALETDRFIRETAIHYDADVEMDRRCAEPPSRAN